MFSGKIEELIRRAARGNCPQRVQIFSRHRSRTPPMKSSHNGLGIPSDNVTKASEL